MLRWLRGGIRGLSAAKTIATKTTAAKTRAGKTIAAKAVAGKTIAAKTTAAKAVAPRRAPQQYIDQDWSRMPDLIGDDVVDSWTALSRTGAASSGASAAAPAAASELQTVGDVFRYAITEFSREEHALAYGQGSVDATDEAHLLLMMHLNLPLSSTGAFMRQWGKSRLTGFEVSALLALITKRVRDKVPVAYLCKGCFQQGEKLYVDERCLIPRSHIGELLAPKSRFFLFKDNIAIRNESTSTSTSKSKRGPRAPGPLEPLPISLRSVRSVLDLCTGSGALAILAHRTLLQHNEDPGLVVHAADISSAALDVARINLQRKQLTSAIHLFCGDLWAALPPNAPLYDLVLCNPPYVDDAAMAALPSEYKQEPELALRGGSTGLALVCRIVEGAAQRLSSEGRLVLECGAAGRRLRGAVAVTGGQWWRTSNSDNEVLVLSRSQSEALASMLSREWRQ